MVHQVKICTSWHTESNAFDASTNVILNFFLSCPLYVRLYQPDVVGRTIALRNAKRVVDKGQNSNMCLPIKQWKSTHSGLPELAWVDCFVYFKNETDKSNLEWRWQQAVTKGTCSRINQLLCCHPSVSFSLHPGLGTILKNFLATEESLQIIEKNLSKKKSLICSLN